MININKPYSKIVGIREEIEQVYDILKSINTSPVLIKGEGLYAAVEFNYWARPREAEELLEQISAQFPACEIYNFFSISDYEEILGTYSGPGKSNLQDLDTYSLIDHNGPYTFILYNSVYCENKIEVVLKNGETKSWDIDRVEESPLTELATEKFSVARLNRAVIRRCSKTDREIWCANCSQLLGGLDNIAEVIVTTKKYLGPDNSTKNMLPDASEAMFTYACLKVVTSYVYDYTRNILTQTTDQYYNVPESVATGKYNYIDKRIGEPSVIERSIPGIDLSAV